MVPLAFLPALALLVFVAAGPTHAQLKTPAAPPTAETSPPIVGSIGWSGVRNVEKAELQERILSVEAN